VCNEHSQIKNRLKDTRWNKNYHKILMRIEGTESSTARFALDPERCVKIPLKSVE
jgi:hypothetical protein